MSTANDFCALKAWWKRTTRPVQAGNASDFYQTWPGKDLGWDTNDPFSLCITDVLFQ
jgi:hypothetical protein